MICKSPISKFLWVISLWLGAIVCIDIGLIPLMNGERILKIILEKVNLYGMLWVPLHYVVLVAGIILLLGIITHAFGWRMTCHCGE